MIAQTKPRSSVDALWAAINQAYLADERTIIDELLVYLDDYDANNVAVLAEELVCGVRKQKHRQSLIEAFLREYGLNTHEGIVLMRIAEALLRIPDSETQDRFLQEKLTAANWRLHLEQSDSFFVNLSTKALLFTSLFEHRAEFSEGLCKQDDYSVFDSLLSRLGAPLIRVALKQAMQYLAEQFVFAYSIEEALIRSKQDLEFRYSFDMLGEAALTAADAMRFFEAYLNAINILAANTVSEDVMINPGVSIKLSALCPRYEALQNVRAVQELTDKLLVLSNAARTAGVSVTIDAEESERLAMSLTIFAAVFSHPVLKAWNGLGLAVQAYQKRALPVIRWLAQLGKEQQKIIPLRLVKGAYWDSEIKRAQENGLSGYPVFTHKSATDLAYLACAKYMLSRPDVLYPQFASHNAHTIAAIYRFGKCHPGYEFQRLHGMGERLYREINDEKNWGVPCRVYAPIGRYQELLPYLVRRLLENGANTSFINQIDRPDISIDELISDPIARVKSSSQRQQIVLPKDLFGEKRQNSSGLNLADLEQLRQLQEDLNALAEKHWKATPLIDGKAISGQEKLIVNPYDNRLIVGNVSVVSPADIERAVHGAARVFDYWRLYPVDKRTGYLLRAAELLEKHRLELVSLCIREGGRTIKDALAEVREAVDYCRYYAQSAMELFGDPIVLPGPTGEDNRLYHYGRGVIACISPWNFPIAIFLGQITAALAAGNTVIAKPATQTVLTAMRCVQLLYEAGIPESVLQFVPASGNTTGQYLLPTPELAGVVFTGSTVTAQTINRALTEHHQKIVPLIAETGGQNVMIADSSALPEQLVQDAITSAFNSAGQRCSALRVLFVQEEIADKTIAMLIGAMQELIIGNPGDYKCDIGPVIDHDAMKPLTIHLALMQGRAKMLYQLQLDKSLRHGSFFPPTLLEMESLSQLTSEVFGPILHVIRYRESELDQVISAVNATGFGLTLGIHSRIDATIKTICQRVKVGNIYVNRNMIGAVVGVQPFGGMGLSGTGPKAGGSDYLRRLVVEQCVTINTAAVGGNAALLSQDLL